MNAGSIRLAVLIAMTAGAGALHAAPAAIAQLDVYRQQGIQQADAERGQQLWYAMSGQRGCTSCHGAKPTNVGKHVNTGKPIEPMAPSLNPARFQSGKTIEKWFLRNCKWTFGRECSTQEKADILTWLAGQ